VTSLAMHSREFVDGKSFDQRHGVEHFGQGPPVGSGEALGLSRFPGLLGEQLPAEWQQVSPAPVGQESRCHSPVRPLRPMAGAAPST